MIYKSFFRKKTTKIYLFIIILIISIFGVLTFGKNYYLELCNQDYEGSFIAVPYQKDIFYKIKEIKDITEIELGIYLDNKVMLKDKNLQRNEVIIPETMKYDYHINDNLNLELNNKEIPLVVKDFTPGSYIIYLNEDLLNENVMDNPQVYAIKIKNWLNYQKTTTKLEKMLNQETIFNVYKKNSIEYENIINIFNIFIVLNLILFFIILIITIFNILEDDKKINIMYQSLGFSKKEIIKSSFLKILILLFISLIISIFIILIISKILF